MFDNYSVKNQNAERMMFRKHYRIVPVDGPAHPFLCDKQPGDEGVGGFDVLEAEALGLTDVMSDRTAE